jgi:yersiniabactin nonribosomal peptide/polyketide synthase
MKTQDIERLIASRYGDAEPIAVVSAACRLPKSPDPILFWRNLFDGIDLLTDVAEGRADRPGDSWVSRVGFLEGAELFDAEFFATSPQEARLMDPQHRVLLTCCWEALESAGYSASGHLGSVAVIASAKTSTYVFPTRADVANIGSPRLFQTLLANDKDYLATRVAYKLGLSGPAYTVQTACSSSLVAVHLACQHLVRQECDLALAGGVGIAFPQDAGYHYREGMIFSRSGQCRAYDARADGTTIGNGAGVVLLKRLRDALRN